MLTKQTIDKHFINEKYESLFFTAVGLIIYKTKAWQGAIIPLITI